MEIIPFLFVLYIGYSIISRFAKAAKTPKSDDLAKQLQTARQNLNQYQSAKNTGSSNKQAGGQFSKRNTADAARIAANLNRIKKRQRRLSHKLRSESVRGRRGTNIDTNRARRSDWGARESKTLSLGNLFGVVIAVTVIWLIIARIAQG